MSAPPPLRHSLAERIIERTLFTSRWLMAPFYLGLIIGLVLLLIEFFRRMAGLISDVLSDQHGNIIIGILSLIDLSLMANLIIMVMFAGYENFVSKLDIDDHKDRPDWMGHVGFGDLKLKLMASIVAISAIHLLEAFLNLDHMDNRLLAWTVGIHLAFIVSGIMMAMMERISHK